MSPEQQRIAIAQACGLKLVTDNPEYEPYWEDPKGNMVAVSNGVHRLPDYLNDLNAMHEAERRLEAEDNHAYGCYCSELYEKYGDTVSLTAAQRAEDFLKTLNLWKPWQTHQKQTENGIG